MTIEIKRNVSERLVLVQLILLVFTIILLTVFGNSYKTDDYGVITVSAPTSVRLQDKSESGIRIERGYAIFDSPNGVIVGEDAVFMGDIYIGDDIGKNVIIIERFGTMIFKNGILVDFIAGGK